MSGMNAVFQLRDDTRILIDCVTKVRFSLLLVNKTTGRLLGRGDTPEDGCVHYFHPPQSVFDSTKFN